jgi:DNA-directed RNA polymerase subunit omega
MNSEYIKQAIAMVGNANVLVNIISKRVRQLSVGGGSNRPLIAESATLGLADIALLELVEGKLGYSISSKTVEEEEAHPVVPGKRKRLS